MAILDDNKSLVRRIVEHHCHSRAGLEALQAFIDACPDVLHTITHLIAEGDLVAAQVRMTGTHTGPFGAIAPTGKVLTLTGAYHCRIVDDKLVEDWDSWTVLPLFQQTVAVLQA